jgi:SpoIID/LytB domain protein
MFAMPNLSSRLFAVVGFGVIFSLLLGVTTSTAVEAPNVSMVKVTPEVWNLSSESLSIKANLDNAGKWRVDLVNLCSGETVVSQTGEKSAAGEFDASFENDVTEDLTAGPFQVVVTPSVGSKVGTAKRQFLKVVSASRPTTHNEVLCNNATRVVSANSISSQIAAINNVAKLNPTESVSAVLFAYGSDSQSIAALATNYATITDQVVLATNGKTLSKSAWKEIQRRGITQVKIVGSKAMISTEIAKALKTASIRIKRFDATDALNLSSLLWSSWTGEPFSSAVLTNYSQDSKTLLQSLAFANAKRVPLIPVSATGNKTSKQILASLQITNGTAVANQIDIADSVLLKFSGFSRIFAADSKELSLSLSSLLDPQPSTLFLRDQNSAISVLDLVSTANEVSIWPVGKSVSDFDLAYIATRPYIQNVFATDFQTTLSDSRVASYAREIYKRDAPRVVDSLEMPEIAALTAPANFSFSGSGWGHGIGMSQWGAYAMATAGKTAAEILTFYFSGTQIGTAVDDADVWVSLQNRIRSLTLRLREVDGDIGTWRLTADDGSEINLTANETATFSFDANAIKVSVTTSKNQTLGPTSKIIATWSGTRFDTDLGTTESAIQVIGPNETTTSGRLYKYGNLRIKAAEATDTFVSGMQVTNRVSLHDEYIYGIGEVSNSWPTESLIAQAIAARSFAYNRAYNGDGTLNNRMGACDCMIYDDIRDQNYVGWSKINSGGGERWKAAVDSSTVDETHSNFVLYNGKVVQTFFAAATGGYTQNNEDVWGGTARPYYRAVPDPWSLMPEAAVSVSVWSPRVRSQQTLAAAFGLTDVAYLDLSDRYVSGGIKTAVAFSTSGASATISGEKFRSRVQSVDGDSLQSTWIWKALVSFAETAAPSFSKAVLSERSLGFAKIPGATATKLVLVQNNSTSQSNLAIASSLAGINKSAIMVTKATNDASRIMDFVNTNLVTEVDVVGSIDAEIFSALQSAGKTVISYSGRDEFETAQLVADSLADTTGQKYVLVNASNPQQLSVATSLSVRTNRPLLLTGEGLLNLQTAQYLLQATEPDVIAVGSPDDVSNAALAAIDNVKRISTEDLGEATLNALYQNQTTTRGLVIADEETPVWKTLLLAATGLPVIYDQDSIRARAIKWLRRQPLSTVIVSLDADEVFVTKVRRS